MGVAVLKFAVTGLLALALLGFVAVKLLERTGTSEAIRNAKQVTRLAGNGIVAPAIGKGLLRGDSAAIASLDRIVHQRVLQDPVVRVKIWTAQGRILYSDEHRLIGSTYPLGQDELKALYRRSTAAELSDLSRPENRLERAHRKLLEVYLGVKASDGQSLLFESYQRFSSITASGRRLWIAFAPALIGALVLLELAQIPLAWSLARRLQRGQREREALLRRAIEASELERRRIARDLHDGAVQNLAGVSYTLAAAADGMEDRDPAAAEAVRQAAAGTRQSIRELRSLLVDIYPPTLHRAGLEPAISDTLTRLSAAGIETALQVEQPLELTQETEALIFRTAQEALRNVMTHSGAGRVDVHVGRLNGGGVLEVSDDGRGFDLSATTSRDGHFGLQMMEDLARDAGGRLQVDCEPGAGTRVRLEVPA
ncbi:MAG: hypothetical protein NVSMB25_17210 [Thermoleophilaceae bacterium]